MRSAMILAAALLLWSATLHAAPFAYIANSGLRSVSVVDTATNTVTATVPLPDTRQDVHPYPYAVTVGSSGQYVYIGLQDTNEVAVIDAATNTVAKRIYLGYETPGGLAVNDSETRLYVTSIYSNVLIIIDISGIGAAEIGRAAVHSDPISNPQAVVLDSGETTAYVANSKNDTVAVVSLDHANKLYLLQSLLPLTAAEFRPMSLALSRNDKKLYVAGMWSSLKIFDFTTDPAGTTILGTGGSTLSLTLKPDDSRLYAPINLFDNLAVIGAPVPTIDWYPLAAGPFGTAITPDGTRLYVTMNTGTGGDTVKVFDTASNTVTATIPLPYNAKPTSIGNFIGPVHPFTITASSGSPCVISPAGAIPVNSKGRTFAVTGSGPCTVTVDGTSVGQPSYYTVSDVSANRTITATPATPGTYYTLDASWPNVCIPEISCNGALISTPAGISGASRSAQFPAGTVVILSPSTGYTAFNWTGDCAGAGATCAIVMDRNRTAGVSLSYNPYCPVKIGATCFSSINDAIDAASSGDLIRVAADYTGPGIGTAGGPVGTVTVSGGWDQTFMFQSGWSQFPASIFQARCAIEADKLIFR